MQLRIVICSAGLFVLIRRKLFGGLNMKTPIYKSYEDLPLYLNAETISKALGIAISSAYELMQEKDFPTFKVGSRKLVEKEKFRKWVDEHSGGGK